MKRALSILLIVIMFAVSSTAFALSSPEDISQENSSSGLDFSPVIAANYVAWAQICGITNLETEPKYYDIQDATYLLIDDLGIAYDPSTMETLFVDLFFIDDRTSKQDTALRTGRVLCLFAALEIGKPSFESNNEADDMIKSMWSIYDKLADCMAYNNDDLMSGQSITFYTGEYGLTYSLSVDANVGIIVHVE